MQNRELYEVSRLAGTVMVGSLAFTDPVLALTDGTKLIGADSVSFSVVRGDTVLEITVNLGVLVP